MLEPVSQMSDLAHGPLVCASWYKSLLVYVSLVFLLLAVKTWRKYATDKWRHGKVFIFYFTYVYDICMTCWDCVCWNVFVMVFLLSSTICKVLSKWKESCSCMSLCCSILYINTAHNSNLYILLTSCNWRYE